MTMAYERDKAEWSRAASIIATIANANRAEGSKPIDPADCSPYTSQGRPSRSGMKLNAGNIHLLRALTK